MLGPSHLKQGGPCGWNRVYEAEGGGKGDQGDSCMEVKCKRPCRAWFFYATLTLNIL